MAPQCPAITDPNTTWPAMCPNLGAAYAYAVFFGVTTIAHVVQMFWTRKPYCWVIAVSAALQTAAYILRILSIKQVTNSGIYSIWFILMMVAPVWTNAYAYMVMGRMVYNFTTTGSVYKIKAWHFGLIFVLLDVFAFFVQAVGASVASGNNDSVKQAMLGIHVYMGGIGFQQLCIFLFLGLAARLHIHLRRQPPSPERKIAFRLLYVEYAVVSLITGRIIFRLIEYSSGITSSVPRHEAYQYVFDSTLMLMALVLLNIFHPGMLMPGKDSNMPGWKARRSLKKQGQAPKGRAGDYKMLEKLRGASPAPSDVEDGLMEPEAHGMRAGRMVSDDAWLCNGLWASIASAKGV
ncbi:hypothetical protein LTR85_009736 [Meristemomyces frigidus]|nr:hypothetical protein LTR85_009736 [Meristemomyces frigidus]